MENIITNEIFERWEDGELDNEEALAALIEGLTRVEAALKEQEGFRTHIRNKLSVIVYQMGDRVDWPNYGRLENTPPGVNVSYNRARLDQLALQLVAEGHAELARRISECRQESERAGYFKITPLYARRKATGPFSGVELNGVEAAGNCDPGAHSEE